MRYTRYTKWTGADWDDLSLEDLMSALAEHLLKSGFEAQFHSRRGRGSGSSMSFEEDEDDALEALRRAIREALKASGLLDDEQYEQLFDENGEARDERLEKLIDQLIRRLLEEGYLRAEGDKEALDARLDHENRRPGREEDYSKVRIKFEVTEKGLDFLGYKTLRDLMGSLGKSSLGRHETRHLSTGIEAYEASKRYEFGDALNLDVNATLVSAIARNGSKVPVALDYEDLMVRQSEYESSCATVLMLDCSHSMILYGEDRFTPAKRVALALAHLIRTQYRGDSLKLVLFHDSAEEVPLAKLGNVQVGPYHTNTCEGLKLARRLLLAQRKDMRQIVMITDGKPSALFVEGGRLYKNPLGLDPRIVEATLAEVAKCRKAGILVNTFMLTDDYYLVDFVRRVSEIARGKAYFTTSLSLGEYVMTDFLRRKTKKVK